MPNPTQNQVEIMWQGATKLLEDYLAATVAGVLPNEEAYFATLLSDFSPQMQNGARLFRSRAAAAAASGSAVLDPVLATYANHVIDTPERSPQRVLDRMYQFFVDNALSVKSRDITFGAIPGFGGNRGILSRLTVDENGFDLEAVFVETKTWRCIRDANTGARRFQEVFEVRGDAAGIDALETSGSGLVNQNSEARTSLDSVLRNSSFSSASIGGSFVDGRYDLLASDTITGWALDDPTSFALEREGPATSNAFARNVVGDRSPTSLVFKVNGKASQTFESANLALSTARPYLSEIWVKPKTGVSAGALTVSWGTESVVIADLSALTPDVWTRLQSPMDGTIWPVTFNEEEAEWSVEVTGLVGGEVAVDEVFFGDMIPLDGTWWHASSAAVDVVDGKFLVDDQQAIADVFASVDSKIQKWLWRSYGRYLPHSDTPTVADPA